MSKNIYSWDILSKIHCDYMLSYVWWTIYFQKNSNSAIFTYDQSFKVEEERDIRKGGCGTQQYQTFLTANET